jgi:hypothetical protein
MTLNVSGVTLSVVIGIATFITSVCVSALVAGRYLGRIEGDVKAVNERLARIEGMFTLRLRDPSD